jgi:predicted Zn-dependent peptidase
MPHSEQLSSGLWVLVEELPHTHSVSLGCFIGAGSRHEPDHLSGVAHFIEHMCFKGTTAFPTARLISEHVEGVGGILNAATSYESTVYWGKVADIHFDRVLKLVADLVCRPLFDLRELEKERRVIIEEIRGIQDTPDDWIYDLLHGSLWGRQPLGRDIAGTIESVTAMSRSDLTRFWQQYYGLSNLVVSIAGNIQTAAAIRAVEAAFVGYQASSAPPAPPTEPPVAGPQLILRPKDTEQGHFCIGFPGLAYTDADRREMQVLDTILGGGMSSRLFQALREDHGLAYNVGSYHSEYADAGMWVIYASVEPEMLRDAIVLSLDIVRDVANHGVTEEELRLVKEQVKGGMLLSLEDTWSVASRNGSHQLRYGTVVPVDQVVAEVEAVTAAGVLRVAQRLVQQERIHVAAIGPYADADKRELEALLREGW